MAITAAMLQKGWTPKRQTIDFAPIKQTPFADYWAGEHAATNDPNLGPWTPEEYEKYKYTKTSDWLKEHPKDYQSSDLLSNSWLRGLTKNSPAQSMSGFVRPLEHTVFDAIKSISGAAKSTPEAISNIPSQVLNPILDSGKQMIKNVPDHIDAALKEVHDILGGARTTYISKEARMQKLLQQIYEMIGKNK